jgi:hypothetical protein
MYRRSWIGRPPRISFTHDFHELLRGDLAPGQRVVIRYDPLRIVPSDDGYVFGDPSRPITAHASFRREGVEEATVVLVSPAGMLRDPDVDVTGAGSVLRGELVVPDDAEELGIWFSYDSPRTGGHLDDDSGRRFRFGFASLQLRILSADVATADDSSSSDVGKGSFRLKVGSSTDVDRVTVRMALVNHSEIRKSEHDLEARDRDEDGEKVWELSPLEVPGNAIVRYKLYYWIGGVRYKDDNAGEYYLAPQPPPETVAPPPPDLLDAAKRWA